MNRSIFAIGTVSMKDPRRAVRTWVFSAGWPRSMGQQLFNPAQKLGEISRNPQAGKNWKLSGTYSSMWRAFLIRGRTSQDCACMETRRALASRRVNTRQLAGVKWFRACTYVWTICHTTLKSARGGCCDRLRHCFTKSLRCFRHSLSCTAPEGRGRLLHKPEALVKALGSTQRLSGCRVVKARGAMWLPYYPQGLAQEQGAIDFCGSASCCHRDLPKCCRATGRNIK